MNNKIGKEVIQQTEQLQLIPEEQSGSRKGRRPVLTALNKVLVTGISQQTRLFLTINNNDDQACYDCTVLWIASLALQRIGLSAEAAFSMTNTLQSTTYDITTAFGIYINKYFPIIPPHQGSGQGNGAGLTIWVMISAILLTIIRDEEFGLNNFSCLYQLALVIVGFAFVDDTEIINAAPSVNTICEELLQQHQRVVDT